MRLNPMFDNMSARAYKKLVRTRAALSLWESNAERELLEHGGARFWSLLRDNEHAKLAKDYETAKAEFEAQLNCDVATTVENASL